MTKPKPYSQSRRIVRRYQVDVIRYVHRFPAYPEPHTRYQASVDMSRGPEDQPDSTFADPVPTEEEAVQDAFRIMARRLLEGEELRKLQELVTESEATIGYAMKAHGARSTAHRNLVAAVRRLLVGDAYFPGLRGPAHIQETAKGETKP